MADVSLSQLLANLRNEELVRVIMELCAGFPGLAELVREKVTQTRRKLFVRNLGPTVTSEIVRAAFSKHGPIEEAVVIHDPVTLRSKQYAFVMYRDSESANRALADRNIVLAGRVADISLALTKESNMVRIAESSRSQNFVQLQNQIQSSSSRFSLKADPAVDQLASSFSSSLYRDSMPNLQEMLPPMNHLRSISAPMSNLSFGFVPEQPTQPSMPLFINHNQSSIYSIPPSDNPRDLRGIYSQLPPRVSPPKVPHSEEEWQSSNSLDSAISQGNASNVSSSPPFEMRRFC